MRLQILLLPLLPLKPPEEAEAHVAEVQTRGGDMIFEPSAEELLGRLLPRYVDTQVFRAVAEAIASEHGARRGLGRQNQAVSR